MNYHHKNCDREILTITMCFIPSESIFTRAAKIPNTVLTRGIRMTRRWLSIAFIIVYTKVENVNKKARIQLWLG